MEQDIKMEAKGYQVIFLVIYFLYRNNLSVLITNFPLSDLTILGIKMFKKDFYNNVEISSNPVGWVFILN